MRRTSLSGPTFEEAILTLLRLGVSGDAESARQYARQLMRRPPKEVEDAGEFASSIGRLLASTGHGPRYLRGRTMPAPAEADSDLPLIREVEVSGAPMPVLPQATRTEIDRFIDEQQSSALAAAGLVASRTLLLTGPPGVGKSMTAAYIASQLGRDLMQMDLAGVISSFLGRTGQNLRRVLDYARQADSVLLLDEFDAVAKRRDDETDVGELKRIVNVLLVELETWPDGHVLIAATNHPELLDRAVRRRFDALVDIPMPGPVEREAILISATAGRLTDRQAKAFALASSGISASDLVRMGESSLRQAVLRNEDFPRVLVSRLVGQGSSLVDRGALKAFAGLAVLEGGLSRREVARLTGRSHPTVSRLVDEWRRDA